MSRITIIGSVSAEIQAKIEGQPKHGTGNRSIVSISYTGTGRNTAAGLGLLGADASFVTTTGNDLVGKGAKKELEEQGIKTDAFYLLDGQNTAMSVQILNMIGDLEMAVGNRDVFECLNKEILQDVLKDLNDSKIIGVDCTFSKESLAYLIKEVKAPLFLDPDTEEDAEKAKDYIGAFHTIAPNRAEASVISGLEIFSEEQLKVAGKWFAKQGVKRIFITLSGGGLYYKEGEKEGILRPKALLQNVKEDGAGAAFSAAALDGFVKGMDVEAVARYGMETAARFLG